MRTQKKQFALNKYLFMAGLFLLTATLFTVNPVFAADAAGTIKDIMEQMIGYVGMIFVAVGVILAVYSVGQLIMAFKNEDADSKSRASTMLVVAIVLISFPGIVDALNLTSYIK